MTPLISESTFEGLRAKRAGIPGRPAHVFLPVAQKNPRVLFIGHAPRGEMPDGTYIEVAQTTYGWLINGMAGGDKKSGFWRAVSSIADQCNRIASPDGLALPVGWSNLCKIGDCDRNPSPKSIREQADLCGEALREKFRSARPEITFLLTGHFAQEEILFPVFGREDWRNNLDSQDLVAVKVHPEFGILLWGYHPRSAHGMARNQDLINFMAGFGAARLLKEG